MSFLWFLLIDIAAGRLARQLDERGWLRVQLVIWSLV